MILINSGYFTYDQRSKHSIIEMCAIVTFRKSRHSTESKVCVLGLECVLCTYTRLNLLYRFITKPTPFSSWIRCTVTSSVMASITVHYTQHAMLTLYFACVHVWHVSVSYQCRASWFSMVFRFIRFFIFFIRINITYNNNL